MDPAVKIDPTYQVYPVCVYKRWIWESCHLLEWCDSSPSELISCCLVSYNIAYNELMFHQLVTFIDSIRILTIYMFCLTGNAASET